MFYFLSSSFIDEKYKVDLIIINLQLILFPLEVFRMYPLGLVKFPFTALDFFVLLPAFKYKHFFFVVFFYNTYILYFGYFCYSFVCIFANLEGV